MKKSRFTEQQIIGVRREQDAMPDALRGLQQRLETEALTPDLLRTQIGAGLDALDRGDFTEVNDAGLDAALDRLDAPEAR